MLHIHHIKTSQGSAGDTVSLSGHFVENNRPNGLCFAGVKFGSDGILYLTNEDGSYAAYVGEWLVNGTAADFYLSRTVDSGTLNNDDDTIQQMNADLEYYITKTGSGFNTATVTFSIYDNGSETTQNGFPIIATMTFNASIS
jgi:hypothetical protein